MKTQSIDTKPETERILISLIKKKSFSKKFFQILSFSQTIIQLSKRAIAKANKDLDVDQVKLLFIEYHYGKDLADRVKSYIANKNNGRT
jgi:hypothetical protein